MRDIVAGLTSTALSHVRCVIGFGSSWSQPLLLKRPSRMVGSGRNAISMPVAAAGAWLNAAIGPAGVIGRVGSAESAMTPSCTVRRQNDSKLFGATGAIGAAGATGASAAVAPLAPIAPVVPVRACQYSR